MLEKLRGKHCIIWTVLCLMYSVMAYLGHMLDLKGYIEVKVIELIAVLVFGIISGMITALLVNFFISYSKQCRDRNSLILSKKVSMALFLIFFLCYLITLLGVYPGFFVYDAQDELLQVITRNFSTHHPLFHVLFLGGIIQAGYKIFGTYNAGIFLFMLIQAAIFSFGNVYMLSVMTRKGIKKGLLILTGIFLGVFPVIHMMVLCSCKDSLFAFSFMMWIASQIDEDQQNKKIPRTFWMIFWGVCMCLLRNNAIYAMLVWGVLALLLRKGKYAVSVVGIVVLSMICSIGVKTLFHAKEGGKQEMLTVPIQQIARVYNYSPEVFELEEIKQLNEYIPEEAWHRYRPKLSDGVKYEFNNELYKQDSGTFWKLWWKGFTKAPLSYANAWFMTSYGYWYPWAKHDVYSGNTVFTFTYDKSSYFGYETEQPGSRDSKIPWIDSFYRNLSLETTKDSIPFIRLLFSPGFLLWGYLFGLAWMITKKQLVNNFHWTIVILIVGTLLLGPTYLPRYVFFMWYSIPLFCCSMKLQ